MKKIKIKVIQILDILNFIKFSKFLSKYKVIDMFNYKFHHFIYLECLIRSFYF